MLWGQDTQTKHVQPDRKGLSFQNKSSLTAARGWASCFSEVCDKLCTRVLMAFLPSVMKLKKLGPF